MAIHPPSNDRLCDGQVAPEPRRIIAMGGLIRGPLCGEG